MSNSIISTDEGIIKILELSEDLIFNLRRWPKQIKKEIKDGNEIYYLGLEDSEGEIIGLKTHFGYYKNKQDAVEMIGLLRAVLPLSIAEYIKLEVKGILLPCGYIKKLDGGDYETGFLVFCIPDKKIDKSQEENEKAPFDDILGKGSWALFEIFIKSFMDVWASNGLPVLTVAELIPETRKNCEGIALDYLVVDNKIISLKNGPVKESVNIVG